MKKEKWSHFKKEKKEKRFNAYDESSLTFYYLSLFLSSQFYVLHCLEGNISFILLLGKLFG